MPTTKKTSASKASKPGKRTTRKSVKRRTPKTIAKKSTARKPAAKRRRTAKRSTTRSAKRSGHSFSHTVAQISGFFEGDINAKGEVRLAPGSTCRANVHAQQFFCNGSFMGDVDCNSDVAVNKGGSFKGNVKAKKFIVAEGASFDGRCKVGSRRAA